VRKGLKKVTRLLQTESSIWLGGIAQLSFVTWILANEKD